MDQPGVQTAEKVDNRSRLIAIGLSLSVGVLLMLSKFYVYWLTHSSAILSDALESIINVVAGAFALWSVILSSKPPDATHPYGHEKIEYFSAGFEGALIIFAAVGIFWTAWPQVLQPRELPHLGSGLLVLLGTGAVNLALGLGLVRVGKRTNSLVLVADGKHILTDVCTSAGVLLGLFLVHLTGWLWLDGGIACLVAVNILVIGSRLLLESFSGLMHKSDPELIEKISELIAKHRRATWIDIHRLRAWRAGNRIQADFHLILPRDLTLEAAHNEASKLEEILKIHLGGRVEALIHAEPCIDMECPVCGYDPCSLRQAPMRHQNLWHRDLLTSQSDEEERDLPKEDPRCHEDRPTAADDEPRDIGQRTLPTDRFRRNTMRIVLIGQAAFGAKTLEALLSEEETIVAVYARPDTPGSRPDPLKELAQSKGIPVFQPRSYRDEEVFAQYRALQPDLAILAFVTDIVPARYFDAASRGAICYHPSLLPRHRGGSAINWAVIMGDTRTGLTIFWPDGGIDTGPILLQKEIEVGPDDTTGSLYFNHLFPMGIEAVIESLRQIKEDRAPRTPQEDAGATYEPLCDDRVAAIDWKKPAREVHNLVRGCDPQPGAYTFWNGEKVRFFGASLQPGALAQAPGTVVEIGPEGIRIALTGGMLTVSSVRGATGGKVPASAWIIEKGLKEGSILGGPG